MSHTFDCVVDTRDMAQSVDGVNRHIETTTGAVVSMKLAVIAAEKEGADHVCEKVNKGFYSLIHSQISQKMAKLQSEVDARLMLMNQQRKQLETIRKRMERDYAQICQRYIKTFTAINRNLKQRITEVDRPVMNLVNTDAEKVQNRSSQLVATVPTGQSESVKVSQRIYTSNLKKQALNTIKSIHGFISASNHFDRLTNAILLRRRIDKNTDELMVPVAVMDSNYDASNNFVTKTYVAEMNLPKETVSTIQNNLDRKSRDNELHWNKPEQISGETLNEFRKLVNDSSIDTRKKQLMLKMCEENNFETLFNG